MAFIYSTMAHDVAFTLWAKSPDGSSHEIQKQVLIKGGAGLPDAKSYNLETPLGIVTRIDDADLPVLEADLAFKHYKKAGYITVQASRKDVDAVVGDMQMPSSKEGAPLNESEITDMSTMEGVEVKINDKKARR